MQILIGVVVLMIVLAAIAYTMYEILYSNSNEEEIVTDANNSTWRVAGPSQGHVPIKDRDPDLDESNPIT